MSGSFAPPPGGGTSDPRLVDITSNFTAASTLQVIRKNAAGTALEYATVSGGGGGGTWGSITGTLSSQTDLTTALNARQPLATNLTTLAGLALTSGNFIRANGSTWQSTALVAGDIPSLDAGKITTGAFAIGRIPTGTTSTTVTLGNDSRLSDSRTPTALSVTNASVSTSAAIALSKLAVDPSLRSNHTGTQLSSTISDFTSTATSLRLDQFAVPTVSVSANSQKIINLGTPTLAADAATKAYVDASAATPNWATPGTIGSTAPNTGSFTNLLTNGTLIRTPATTQTLTAASTINNTNSIQPISSASGITLTSNPQVSVSGVSNGQEIEIVNVGSFNISFADGNGLILGRAITLFPSRSLRLRYNAVYSSWLDTGFNQFAVTQGLNSNDSSVATNAYVNTSNRPYVNALRSTTAQTSLVNNGWSQLIYNNELTDTNNIYDPATGVFTIPASLGGLYRISYGVQLSGNCGVIALSVHQGVTEVRRVASTYSATDVISNCVGSMDIPLSASTAYNARCYYFNSTSATFNLQPDNLSFLTICRLNV